MLRSNYSRTYCNFFSDLNVFLLQIAQLREDVLPQHNKGYLGMQDLDLTPVSMDRVAFEFLHRFRPGGHFQLVKGYH